MADGTTTAKLRELGSLAGGVRATVPVPHPCNGRGEAGVACAMQEFRDPAYLVRRWQHGENPEHSLEVTELALVRGGLVPVLWETGEVRRCFKVGIDWLTRLHQYEAAP